MKPNILLCLALVLSGGISCSSAIAQSLNVADIKITFADPPVAPSFDTLPGEAYLPRHDSVEHGAFTNIVAGHIAALNVTWADSKYFKTEEQTKNVLKELLSSTNTTSGPFHIWSWVDGVPNMVATVEHTAGKKGRWVIWFSPAIYWAYQDEYGKWWWGEWHQKVPIWFPVNMEAIPWGEMAGGLQMASAVDVPNGVIHNWVRNGEPNELRYNDFDFGYWEFTALEVRQGTNWVNVPRAIGGIYSGGGHPSGQIKGLAPKQVITDGNWFIYEDNRTYAALLREADRAPGSRRIPVSASFCYDDTFTLDLMAFKRPAGTANTPVEARVRQTFYPVVPGAAPKEATLYSPVFTLDGSALEFFEPENHDTSK